MSDAWATVLQDEALFMQTNRRGIDYARSLRLMLEADQAESNSWHVDLMLTFSWSKYATEYADLPGVGVGIVSAANELKVVTLCPSRADLVRFRHGWEDTGGPPCGFGVIPRDMFNEIIDEERLQLLLDRCSRFGEGFHGFPAETLH